MVDSSRALLDEVSEERLLSIDVVWRLLRKGSWRHRCEGAQMRAKIVIGLVTSLRIAYNRCATGVCWPTPQQDKRF